MTTVPEKRSGVSRRNFLSGSLGLTFAFTVGGLLSDRPGEVLAAAGAEAREIGAWVTIAPDGRISIAAPAAEMGQGVLTSLPMILAEEMDADWSRVEAVFAPADPDVFGNPGLGGGMITVGSRAVSGYWTKVRLQGAAVRRFLMQTAAEQWGMPVDEVSTEPGYVIHPASGKSLSYGEIAAIADQPDSLPEVTEADLKKPADFRIIGRETPRLDVPSKVDGSARFGIDAKVPGMVYATVRHAPVVGAEPASVNSDEVEARDGVIRVVHMPNAVAVVGETVETVFAARETLQIDWQGGDTAGYNSEEALETFAKRASGEEGGLPYFKQGDTHSAKTAAAKTIKSDYMSDYVYHAQMEPMNITASVDETSKKAEIWVGTQSPSGIVGAATAALETEPQNIRLHQHYLGGGFGRRAAVETVPEVLFLAKEMKRPVKVIWTREEDVNAALMRPQTAHHLEAAIDESGLIIGWHHRIVAEAVTGYSSPDRLEQAKGLAPLTLEGATHQYSIPNQLVEYLRHVNGTRLQAWRAIGAGYNKFAIECFIDEIAHEQGIDPVELRLKLLKDEPRARAVVEATAEIADWGRKPEAGRAFGFAYGQVVGSYVAGVAEISVDEDTGVVRAHNFWNVVDPGIAVNPATIIAQLESNVVFGLSQALKERIVLVDGAVQQSNYHDYEILRMSETPEIHTKVLQTDYAPSGIGEVSLPMVAAAVSNAFFELKGRRLRHMPFTPDRVKEVLS